MAGITAWDGSDGWTIQPFNGKKDPEPLSEGARKGIIEDADLDGPLVNWKAKGNKVEYLGKEVIEGTDTHKIRVTVPNGDSYVYFLDTDYYVPIKYETRRLIRGVEREFETFLGDYKDVDGWYLPFSIETGARGSSNRQKFTVESIEINVPIDASRFHKPASGAPAEAAGAWAAPKEATSSRGAPPVATADNAPITISSDTISGLGARNIGSATMSGRVAALDAVHEGNRLTIYVGSASGGIWKSQNGGTTYKPVFDKQPVQSIGAIAIDPKNPKVVWAGTGEAWTRNSVSIGDGLYKSTDGGDNWTNTGLGNSERIARILIDPTDTDTVYVCVPGKLWSDSDDRGVYKTSDGGKSWTKVLKGGNASTGCSMISMDRANPKTLYAGLWDFRRQAWTFRSGGDGPNAPSGSGLYKSTDGGTTWSDVSSATGLPAKPWGRVAMAVAPSKSKVVYTFIETDPPKNGLYRSDDAGQTWHALDRSFNMIQRPFYFANLIVDPKDENKLYKPDYNLIVSNDGGKSFSPIGGSAHGDFHDVWVDPQNTDHLITGDDGGIWYSYNGGGHWWKAENLPISQFYHVSLDMDTPYHVYGGLQDNGSWVGASDYPGGIANAQWESMYFGDGFWMFADPTDNDYLYAESQGGDIGRVNRKTHQIRNIRPLPHYKEGKLRFNWNTPIHVSSTGAIYLGAEFLFRTKDHGQTWERISPDLTTNDPDKQKQELSGGVTVDNSAAEMHTTIYAIAESPKNADLIWVGTDDGNLQLTRDGGKSWTNVSANVPGIPRNAWVTSVEPSRFDEGTAYATLDAHTFGDMRPYVYRTNDYGRSWTPLVAPGSPMRGYAHVVREDPVDRDLLFAGTELGLWISIDGGKQWAQYKGGDMPSVAVRDVAVHPRDHDLVIATHGSGIWIVDDITPLRKLTESILQDKAAFLAGRPILQVIQPYGGYPSGSADYNGETPNGDAVITYYQRRRHIFGDLKIEILDAGGKLVETIPSSKRLGLSRVSWSMRLPPPPVPRAATLAQAGTAGPRILPGVYTVRMTKDGEVFTTKLEVLADPRWNATPEDRRAQFELSKRLCAIFADMTFAVDRINGVRDALMKQVTALPSRDKKRFRLEKAADELDAMRKRIVATKEGGMLTGEIRLREQLDELYGNVVFYEGPPTQTEVERTDAIARELADVMKDFDAWTAKTLPALNAAVKVLPREDWEKGRVTEEGGATVRTSIERD
ncbi:MAG TPA: sialidase [Thermoanaerobaculia bacterium]|nr:sialidase [Thermoanaerobaculia bacterium]